MFVLFLHCFVTRRCVLTQIRHSNVVSLTSLKKKQRETERQIAKMVLQKRLKT